MHVEVNEQNIDLYNLIELTGNSREEMLSRAAEAREQGHILSCDVPDNLVIKQNVFEVYESEHVDPKRLRGCGYEKREIAEGGEIWVCVMHGKSSRYDVSADSHLPCIQVDPEVQPDPEQFKEALKNLPKTCVYNEIDHPSGKIHICAVHGEPSKFDIDRLPNMPCQAIDPKVV